MAVAAAAAPDAILGHVFPGGVGDCGGGGANGAKVGFSRNAKPRKGSVQGAEKNSSGGIEHANVAGGSGVGVAPGGVMGVKRGTLFDL